MKNKSPKSTTALSKASKQEISASEFIPAEMFLENTGFFTPSSKRIRHVYSKIKKVAERVGEDGKKRAIKVRISANHSLGLPITSDLDYYRAFLKICDELVDKDGRFQLPIPVPTHKLIRYAEKAPSARAKREVREWLNRMTLTGIEGGVYLAKQSDYAEGFIGTVFSQVVIKGQTMRSGKAAETNYVWPAPWFLSNYYWRYLRRIDLEFHNRLRKPIAKSLYPLLETGWYASGGKAYVKRYGDLCEEFLLKSYKQLARIKQQLDPAHEELKKERFLKSWNYRRSADESDWIIGYWPGEKFFEDQEAHRRRKEIAETIDVRSLKPQPKAKLTDGEEYLLSEILEICGDTQNEAAYRKVTREYSEGLIWMTISETRQAALEGRIKKNKGAYFMDTIKRLAAMRQEGKKT